MITIHEQAFREFTLDDCDKEDVTIYDQKIDEFLQYLTKKAKMRGIEITCSKENLDILYSADTDQEHEFFVHSLDFWEWYEGKRCIYSFI